MAAGSTGILKYFKPVGQVSRRHPRLPKPFLIWMVCWAKGLQLKPNHRQLGHCKLYIYEQQVYVYRLHVHKGVYEWPWHWGAAILCSVLQVVLIFWRTSIHQSFTPGPPLVLGSLNFCLISQVGDLPKFFRQCNIFADSPKFYAANVSRYTVSCWLCIHL